MLNKLLDKLQGEIKMYAVAALKEPSEKTTFEYGSHHGVLKGFGLVERWIQELLEEQEGDENE